MNDLILNNPQIMNSAAKAPKKIWKIVLLILGIILIIDSLFMHFTEYRNADKPVQMIENCKATPQEMIESGNVYKFENAAVLNYYAATNFESETSNQCHFIVGYFEDENDTNVHLASMTLTRNDGEILNTMFDYSESDEIQSITFFAKALPISKLNDEVYDYYKEDVEYFNENYTNIIDSGLCLDYCFDDASQFDDFCKSNENMAKNSKTTTVIMLIIGAVLILIGIPKRKKNKKESEPIMETYNAQSNEEDSYSYINSEEYFPKFDDDSRY
ncbi:MAG: hypothetical protein HDT34_01095 [Clostridiales bacterium]|nr:hypothetical protein [Clostridiales bacterium]